MKNNLFQVKVFFKVKLNSFFMWFGIHLPAPIKEALSIVVRFYIQGKGSFWQNWRFWHILWKTIQSLIQKVLIKKAVIWTKRSWSSWIGLIDIQELQIRSFEVLPRKHWLILIFLTSKTKTYSGNFSKTSLFLTYTFNGLCWWN